MLQRSAIQTTKSWLSATARKIFSLMHRFRLVLFSCAFFIVCGIAWYVFDNYKKTDPVMVCKEFLAQVERGDIQKAKSYFGGRCPCTTPGGWTSYFVYKSGQEPNLAFLVGTHFSTNDFSKQILPSNSNYPNKKLCLVTVPITFLQQDRPFFLPVKMAFGETMQESALLNFSHKPELEWQKGFTLRLRPSISKGAIDHSAAIEINKNSKLLSTYEKRAEDLFRLLGDDVAAFLPPKDAGPVIRADKTFLQQKEIENLLPRANKLNLNLLLVQKDNSPYWSITQCKIAQPELQTATNSLTALKESNLSSM